MDGTIFTSDVTRSKRYQLRLEKGPHAASAIHDPFVTKFIFINKQLILHNYSKRHMTSKRLNCIHFNDNIHNIMK